MKFLKFVFLVFCFGNYFLNTLFAQEIIETGSSKIDAGKTLPPLIVMIDSAIAHNATIEENSLVIAHAMVAGSVKVGKNTWVAPGALIKNGLDIGDNVFIGLGAVVIKNIPDNETWIGNPAKPLIK